MHFRLCEWASVEVRGLTAAQRHALAEAVDEWRIAHRLPRAPLTFGGVDGTILTAAQYVGVVQAGGVTVEIFPKLDAALTAATTPPPARLPTVMSNLLWLLEESGHGRLIDAGSAPLTECPDNFPDLLAWLLARRLQEQFWQGAPHDYRAREDDLPMLRGRIDFPRQAGRLWMRPDKIACRWEDYSADIPLTRVLHCAAREMRHRVRLPAAAADLETALSMMPEVTPCRAAEALALAAQVRWPRQAERWRPCFDLSVALLSGLGREWRSGDAGTFVFLLDMNKVFEDFCAVRLEQWFGVPVRTQEFLGHLLGGKRAGLRQYADFVWQTRDGTCWIGDAKYKRAAATDGTSWLDVADVRQLICYGQMHAPDGPRRLMLLHPVTEFTKPVEMVTYEHTALHIVPVPVVQTNPLNSLVPFADASGGDFRAWHAEVAVVAL